jgi:aspartate racemase
MKQLGLLGGMSWESTTLYYQFLNRRVQQRLGGLHSAKCIIFSFDFAELESLQRAGKWDQAGSLLCEEAIRLRDAGAQALLICANTFHIVADAVATSSGLPVLHIADFTATAVKAKGLSKVGLLGTRYTMEKDFYKKRLVEKHGLDVIIPSSSSRTIVHDIIYHELCQGVVTEKSKAAYIAVIQELVEAGAECVILGCTEIQMLITAEDSPVPIFDTTALHAEGAADWALES